MTRSDFIALCEMYAVAPAIALENEQLTEALRECDDDEVERLLSEEF